jgi:hypothetical protein
MNPSTAIKTTATATSITTVITTTTPISPWKTDPQKYNNKKKIRDKDRRNGRHKKNSNTYNLYSNREYGRQNGKNFEIYNCFDPRSRSDIDQQFMNNKERAEHLEVKKEFLDTYYKSPRSPFWKKGKDYWCNYNYNRLTYYLY